MRYKLEGLMLKKFQKQYNLKCQTIQFVLDNKKWYILIDDKIKLRISKKIVDEYCQNKSS